MPTSGNNVVHIPVFLHSNHSLASALYLSPSASFPFLPPSFLFSLYPSLSYSILCFLLSLYPTSFSFFLPPILPCGAVYVLYSVHTNLIFRFLHYNFKFPLQPMHGSHSRTIFAYNFRKPFSRNQKCSLKSFWI